MQEASLLKTMIRCDLGGARTLDPLIKSQLLYQLSYEVNPHSGESPATSFLNRDAKVQLFLNNASVSSNFFSSHTFCPTDQTPQRSDTSAVSHIDRDRYAVSFASCHLCYKRIRPSSRRYLTRRVPSAKVTRGMLGDIDSRHPYPAVVPLHRLLRDTAARSTIGTE